MPGFQSFFSIFASFCIGQISSVRDQVACRVNNFSSTLHVFDNSACIKYRLPKRTSDEEYVHLNLIHKYILCNTYTLILLKKWNCSKIHKKYADSNCLGSDILISVSIRLCPEQISMW